MIPSQAAGYAWIGSVYQRGLVIDSQRVVVHVVGVISISKGIGD